MNSPNDWSREYIDELTHNQFAWLKKTFPRWTSIWTDSVWDHASKKTDWFVPLQERSIETWIKWNLELAHDE